VQLLTLIELARREIRLARDIIFLATPDEEAGGIDAAYNNALVRTTLSVTVLEASPRTNMLPTKAVAHLDVRVLPGASCQETTETVRRVVDDPKIRVETLLSFPAKSSSVETDLFRAIGRVARRLDSEAIVVPLVIAGFTDAHYFRELGITAYGFVPRWFSPGEARGVHGPNEHAHVENLGRGVETFISILQELDRLELAARSARTR